MSEQESSIRNHQVATYVTATEHKQIRQLAEHNHRSISNQIRVSILNDVQRQLK